MMLYLTVYYDNPYFRTHMYGWESEAAVEHARQQIADLIGADKKEVITSGATECNNIAMKVARFYKSRKNHVVTTQTVRKLHLYNKSCFLSNLSRSTNVFWIRVEPLEAEGFDVTYISVNSNGLIDLNEVEAAIRPSTSLISVMMVNNEISVKQPIEVVGIICRKKKVFFHTDAAQIVAKRKNHGVTTQTVRKLHLYNKSCFLIDIMNLLNLSRSTNVYWIRVEPLEAEGFDVTYISVNSNDLIDLNKEAAIRPSTSLVSVMVMNNEISVKQPIEEVGAICRKKKVFFTQMLRKLLRDI